MVGWDGGLTDEKGGPGKGGGGQDPLTPSTILAFQNVQGTLECYSKLKDKLGLKTSR